MAILRDSREILAECARRGIELRPEGDAIRYSCPKGAMTDDLREAIRRHKALLLRLLTHEPLDWRRHPTTGAWVRDPGWWWSTPGQPSPGPKLVQPTPLPPAEGREPARSIALALSLRSDGTCWRCGGAEWWVSIYGVLVCTTCHPSAGPGLVARYVGRDEASRLASVER